jgi:hypothetical protein
MTFTHSTTRRKQADTSPDPPKVRLCHGLSLGALGRRGGGAVVASRVETEAEATRARGGDDPHTRRSSYSGVQSGYALTPMQCHLWGRTYHHWRRERLSKQRFCLVRIGRFGWETKSDAAVSPRPRNPPHTTVARTEGGRCVPRSKAVLLSPRAKNAIRPIGTKRIPETAQS